ncbi:MAG: hypothetical protein D8M58_02365 [Calditrichaeota bacterium]|nr:MAG: hypothetical protein DWQ03_04715 [Calditrichota bacterium]MBL1204208.1 hypothetical protein [Calditrichota bacterium]NOG44038.1 hypothetical protein [Calditrichota bacterium]
MKIFLVVLLHFASATCQVNEPPQENPFFEVLYFANLNGNIENCNCGDPPLGGLDRIATIIEKQRSKNPELIVIDGGDTFNTYPFIELDKAIVEAYQIIKPDIWVLSEQELIEGTSFLAKISKNNLGEHVSSNYRIKQLPESNSKKPLIAGNTNITFNSFLSPKIVRDYANQIDNNSGLFFQNLKTLKESDFNILLLHGEESDLVDYTTKFKIFDLILMAHEQSDVINLNAKPAIIGSGADGENIIYISLHKSNNKIIINAARISVGLEIEPHPAIVPIITKYKESINQRDQ